MSARRTARWLSDGREIVYFDDRLAGTARDAVDRRPPRQVAGSAEIRTDPLTGERVVIAAHRQNRTHHPSARDCPLCPSAPGRPSEIPEDDYDVVAFENRFPAFGGAVSPTGRCEVVCFTAEHDSSFGQLTPQRVQTVLDAWADRTSTVGRSPGVRQVYCFENRGAEIGVTLSHPHGQIYGYPFVTPPTERELRRAARHHRETGRHLWSDVLAAEHAGRSRLVHRGEHWSLLVPHAAKWPVHVQLVPHRQVPDIATLDAAQRAEFGLLYLDLLARLDRLYGRPLPYVAGWHQAPVRRGRRLAWLRMEVFSVRRGADKLKYPAGSESGMGVWLNDRTPEQIARELRAV